ncbi:hypothetical protein FOVG_16246 [Fusarium oxysporum f. sp. pisi HDV247]|uniref:C2H2-type domain-containing protein n=1 Tax=Fusarium oxysporum f. sp. pisi HDV247 TaxID=1080344 RepID=W9NRE5_FUSOX|nr:hypothetical protein FOVG_16246 [Fusarium oxysporum f. sp. pisi HDV247]
MSIVALISTGPQTHQQFSVGLMLHDSNYYSIAPKQRKLQAKLDIFLQQLCVLSLYAEFCETVGSNRNKAQEAVGKVHKEALPLPAKGQINAAIRHYNNGANGASNAVVLFPRNVVHCQGPVLHCLTLESSSSQPSGFGYKRVHSPGSANQSGEKKQRSGQQNNDNQGRDNKGNGQGPAKKKRGFGPQQPSGKKFACLFYKLDSGKYECCAGYNLTRWDHVLQHLKRIHLIQEEHCPKCREEFEGEFAEHHKNQHIRRNTCKERTAMDTGLLLEDEYNGLTGLHGSHEEKWREAWKKLFARHPAPYSPFIESLESVLDAQCNTLERELPSLLQSFLHDASVGPGTVSAAGTINAILRLVRNPMPVSTSLANGEPQTEFATPMLGPSSRAHEIPPCRTPEPPASTAEPFGPSTDAVYAQPIIPTMEETNMYESLWHQSFGEFPIFSTVFDPGNEDPDQWINFSGDGVI